MARPKLKGRNPQPYQSDDFGKVLAVATDLALRDFRFFLNFVYTLDEAEPDPLLKIKKYPTDLDYLQFVADELQVEKFLLLPKSRRLIMTWTVSAWMVWQALKGGFHGFLQTKKEDDADYLIKERVWFIYQHLPGWLKYLANRGKTDALYKYCKLQFPNGSKIWGIPQGPDQLRQYTASAVFIDEAAYHDLLEDSLATILPLREKGCAVVLVSSAQPSYFGGLRGSLVTGPIEGEIRNVMRGIQTWRLKELPGAKVVRIHYTADPNKDPERDGRVWIDTTLEQYPGGKDGSLWRQEMEIDFSAYSGQLVYDLFTDEAPHIVRPFDLPVDCTRWRSIDYGRTNPTACIWIAEVDGHFYAYREFYRSYSALSETKQVIHEMSLPDNCRYQFTWMDPSTDAITAQDEPTFMYIFNQEPFGLCALKGDRNWAGTVYITELLRTNRFHVFENLTNLRYEFRNYRFEEFADLTREKYNAKEKVRKKDDHLLDALKMWGNGMRWIRNDAPTIHTPTVNPIQLPEWLRRRKDMSRYMGNKGIIRSGYQTY